MPTTAGGSYYPDGATAASQATWAAAMATAEEARLAAVTAAQALVPKAVADHTLVTHLAGLFVLNTTTGIMYQSDGAAWKAVAGAGVDVALGAAAGYTSSATHRLLYSGGAIFVEIWGSIAINTGNLVRATTIGTLTAGLRPLTSVRVPVAIGNATSNLGTSSCTISTGGVIQLTGDNTSLGAHTVAYLDGIPPLRVN